MQIQAGWKRMNPWRGLKGLPWEVWVLFFTTLINRAGTMVLPFLVLYLTRVQGVSTARAGMILTIYGIGSLISAPISGKLSDRFGPNAVIVASLATSGVVFLIFPLFSGLSQILPMTLVLAFTSEMFRPAGLAFISRYVSAEQRKPSFALSRLAVNIGMSIGPAVGGFLATTSFSYLFWVDGITSIAGCGIFLAFVLRMRPVVQREPEGQKPGGMSDSEKSRAWRDGRLVYFLLSQLPAMLAFFQHMAALPLFLVRDLQFSETVYGALFTINTVMIIALEVPLNLATNHWSFSRSLSLGALLFGVGFGGLLFTNHTFGVIITVVIWTFGEMILVPAAAAYVAHLAPPERQGEYMGLYTMGFGLAFMIGPWLGTGILDAHGSAVLWMVMGIFGMSSALLLGRIRNGKPVRREEITKEFDPGDHQR